MTAYVARVGIGGMGDLLKKLEAASKLLQTKVEASQKLGDEIIRKAEGPQKAGILSLPAEKKPILAN
jgi:hypothetical protein